MKKILFVVDDQKIGGVSIVLREILSKIDKVNNRIDLLILNNEGDCLNNISNINYLESIPFYTVCNKSLKEVLKSNNIINILKKIQLIFLMKTGLIKNKIKQNRKKILKDNYDVEIAYKDGFCTVFTAAGDSKKKITFLHTDYSNNNPAKKYYKTFQNSINTLDVVVAISEDIKNKFNEIYGVKDKTIVINNYMDKDKIISKSNEENIKYNSKLEFITVGRFHPVKGYDRLIEVFHKLNKELLLKDVHLTMIGDGDIKSDIENKIKEYNLNNYISLMGLKKNPYPYIKQADCMIISSLSEGYPLTIIESMTLNTPVFTLDFSSAKEMISQGVTGIIKDNSIDGLYDGLIEIIDNPNILNGIKLNLEKTKNDGKEIIVKIEKLWK